jgi:hypothetical protein
MAQTVELQPTRSATPRVTYLALMVTRRCNMACGHCSVESGPLVKGEPSEAELLQYVRQAAAAGVRTIQITGGEPMLREKVVLRLVRECQRLRVATAMTTNGFWGKSPAGARRRLTALRRAGLGALTVSFDRYHAEFQGPQAARHIAEAAEELNFPVNINVVRLAADPELPQLVAPFAGITSARLRFYDVQPIGRARTLPGDVLRGEVEGFCGACAVPAITDDGRVTACNGPSYFAGPQSPLSVGSLREMSLPALLDRHQQDPILDTIRTFGPARLRDELQKIAGFETFPFRQRYTGLCDLCHHLTSSPEAVAALRLRLVQPSFTAERVAARRVIDASRREGILNRDYVNGIGACRIFLNLAREPEGAWGQEADRILGRADFDWGHQAAYLSGCGLARPFLKVLHHPVLTRWAPQFFLDRVKGRAIKDGFCELVQREALRRLAQVLQEVGGTGVLLKGAARLALAMEEENATPMRAAGDLDVYVEPALAPLVRGKLLERGWGGEVDGLLPASHHLAPVTFQGIPLEIHTRIMPAFWGLPEKDLLGSTRPVRGLDPFLTLDPEGFLLHTMMHASTHLFSQGLKTAWDLLWVLDRFAPLDWERLARWVSMTRVPRGFWVPFRVLCQDLEIPVPEEFLRYAPADTRQCNLEVIARRRLFQELEGSAALNPFSRNAVFFLLHDSWLSRARYLISWFEGQKIKSQGNLQRTVSDLAFTHTVAQLRQALAHWRQYRRALARRV